ncbi:MAG: 1-deoxy-D-xylulose-5-phosphate reductoisomerase, partial [bacterium]
MKRVVVLGSTGSIGRQTLDVISSHSEELHVVGLLANTSGEELRAQGAAFGCQNLVLMDEAAGKEHGLPAGVQAACDLATRADADIVVVSVAGVVGLLPTMAAIQAGKDIALASKEVLVAAGEVVTEAV